MLERGERIAVIVSCYNNWASLAKTLWGLEAQTDKGFRVYLADDGSGEAFRAEVAAYAAGSALEIEHVWHADDGYRKAVILNRAVERVSERYILFTDGDIVVRADWVDAHRWAARRGFYMAGGSHINIPAAVQARLDRAAVVAQRLFDVGWLAAQGMARARRYRWRLASYGWRAQVLDILSMRANSFVGCNSGCWRADIEKVGGFDEGFGYSAEDRDLGIRLANAGVRGVRRRYSFACVHLDHPRPYLDAAEVRRCKALIRQRRRAGVVRVGKGEG